MDRYAPKIWPRIRKRVGKRLQVAAENTKYSKQKKSKKKTKGTVVTIFITQSSDGYTSKCRNLEKLKAIISADFVVFSVFEAALVSFDISLCFAKEIL